MSDDEFEGEWEVWDRVSCNRLATFGSLAEAESWISEEIPPEESADLVIGR